MGETESQNLRGECPGCQGPLGTRLRSHLLTNSRAHPAVPSSVTPGTPRGATPHTHAGKQRKQRGARPLRRRGGEGTAGRGHVAEGHGGRSTPCCPAGHSGKGAASTCSPAAWGNILCCALGSFSPSFTSPVGKSSLCLTDHCQAVPSCDIMPYTQGTKPVLPSLLRADLGTGPTPPLPFTARAASCPAPSDTESRRRGSSWHPGPSLAPGAQSQRRLIPGTHALELAAGLTPDGDKEGERGSEGGPGGGRWPGMQEWHPCRDPQAQAGQGSGLSEARPRHRLSSEPGVGGRSPEGGAQSPWREPRLVAQAAHRASAVTGGSPPTLCRVAVLAACGIWRATGELFSTGLDFVSDLPPTPPLRAGAALGPELPAGTLQDTEGPEPALGAPGQERCSPEQGFHGASVQSKALRK
ncbi:collagen alpha-1(I) chain-like [Marmota monax]|uniref:collagen alpha-1(I) chain-like n=1 Tax=Marmota monax TaxID=9995 RepID=UPI001EB05DA5|nr:collagen alpha-1(I) chain-like [Marmota monax]